MLAEPMNLVASQQAVINSNVAPKQIFQRIVFHLVRLNMHNKKRAFFITEEVSELAKCMMASLII